MSIIEGSRGEGKGEGDREMGTMVVGNVKRWVLTLYDGNLIINNFVIVYLMLIQ